MKRSATFAFADLVRDGALEVGDGYRAKNSELGGSGLIFLRSAYLQDSGFNLANPDRFIDETPDRFGRKISQLGDVVITTKGNSTGRIGRILREQAGAVYSPHLSYWRSKDAYRIDQAFLYYWSKSAEFRGQLYGMAHSTDMAPYLSLGDQLRLKITLPAVGIQIAIGKLLGALDDKIELNRRMNETLEAMARAIFKDWFVDFGPTRAKMEGRAPYLAPDIWALFPDRLDDEGKPTGWKTKPFLELASLLSGGTPKTDRTDFWGGGIAWASAKDVSQCGEIFLFDTERSITDAGLNGSATRLIPANSTVVVARGATTGRFCMFGLEMAMNQTCYALKSKSGHDFWTNCAFAQLVESLVHAAHGSVFDTITTSTFERASFVDDPDVADAFEAIAAPLFARMAANIDENRTLAATRDLLLPKLMSGEIRIRDAQAMVADAA